MKKLSLILAVVLLLTALFPGFAMAEEDVFALPEGWFEYSRTEKEKGAVVSVLRRSDVRNTEVKLEAFDFESAVVYNEDLSNKSEVQTALVAWGGVDRYACKADKNYEAKTQHLVIKQKYPVYKQVLRSEDGSAVGFVYVVPKDGKVLSAKVTDHSGDTEKCETLLTECLYYITSGEKLDLGGRSVYVPHGFELTSDSAIDSGGRKLLYQNDGSILQFVTMEFTQERMDKLRAEYTEPELLETLAKSLETGLETGNQETEVINYGKYAVRRTLDVTVNGSKGVVCTYAVMNGNTLNLTCLITTAMDRKEARQIISVTNPLYVIGWDVKLGPPDGFKAVEVETNGEYATATFVDTPAPQVNVTTAHLSQETLDEKSPRELLKTAFEASSYAPYIKAADIRYENLEGGALCLRGSCRVSRYGVVYGYGVAYMLKNDRLTRVEIRLPDGTKEQCDEQLTGFFAAKPVSNEKTFGHVTLMIPEGWAVEEKVSDEGQVIVKASNTQGVVLVYEQTIPEFMTAMLQEGDIQTALEIYLSVTYEINDIATGLTIEYMPCANDVHLVRSAYTVDEVAIETVAWLDNGRLFLMEAQSFTEEEAKALMDEMLAPML